jgi:hypothetical protein
MPSPEEQPPQTAPPAPAVQRETRPVSTAQQTQYSAPNHQSIYAQMPQFTDFEKLRPPPPFSRAWHIAKLVLGSASIVCSTVLIALAIAIAALFGESYEAYSDVIAVVIPVNNMEPSKLKEARLT